MISKKYLTSRYNKPNQLKKDEKRSHRAYPDTLTSTLPTNLFIWNFKKIQHYAMGTHVS